MLRSQLGARLSRGSARLAPLCRPRWMARPYATQPHDLREPMPKLRYFVLTIFVSFGVITLVSGMIDKKKPTNADLAVDGSRTGDDGLKRKIKTFKEDEIAVYMSPLPTDEQKLAKLTEKLKAQIIDPAKLIEAQIESDSSQYGALLSELRQSQKKLPKGLVTALVKQELKRLHEMTDEKTFLIKEFPQNIDEAIKFEEDVTSTRKILAFVGDLAVEQSKEIGDVLSYFDTVQKVVKINQELSEELMGVILEDF